MTDQLQTFVKKLRSVDELSARAKALLRKYSRQEAPAIIENIMDFLFLELVFSFRPIKQLDINNRIFVAEFRGLPALFIKDWHVLEEDATIPVEKCLADLSQAYMAYLVVSAEKEFQASILKKYLHSQSD